MHVPWHQCGVLQHMPHPSTSFSFGFMSVKKNEDWNVTDSVVCLPVSIRLMGVHRLLCLQSTERRDVTSDCYISSVCEKHKKPRIIFSSAHGWKADKMLTSEMWSNKVNFSLMVQNRVWINVHDAKNIRNVPKSLVLCFKSQTTETKISLQMQNPYRKYSNGPCLRACRDVFWEWLKVNELHPVQLRTIMCWRMNCVCLLCTTDGLLLLINQTHLFSASSGTGQTVQRIISWSDWTLMTADGHHSTLHLLLPATKTPSQLPAASLFTVTVRWLD